MGLSDAVFELVLAAVASSCAAQQPGRAGEGARREERPRNATSGGVCACSRESRAPAASQGAANQTVSNKPAQESQKNVKPALLGRLQRGSPRESQRCWPERGVGRCTELF